MKVVAIIPARYQSTRFPGKPLADICGKPMIWWVYQQCLKVKGLSDVIVATESEKIVEVCKKYGIDAMLTSDLCTSGTERTAEVAQSVKSDAYVVVMGDEPLVSPDNISLVVEDLAANSQNYDAVMLCKKFDNGVDVINNTTIKLAINDSKELIYMSRATIPYPKAMLNYDLYKNIGVYGFKKEALEYYRTTSRGILEKIEDCEMLRMIENHKIVKTIEVDSESMSVDTYKDLERIRQHISSIS